MSSAFSAVFVCFLLNLANSWTGLNTDTKDLHPTSCLDLPDGYQYIRPLENTETNIFPSIKVYCTSGYAVLDHSIDANIEYYFSSFFRWTDDASSAVLSDRVTWHQWFLPAQQSTKFAISPDCKSCQPSSISVFSPLTNITINNKIISPLTQTLSSGSAYFMTGNYYGCIFATKAYCDMDTLTLQCHQCYSPSNTDTPMVGLCTHVSMESTTNSEIAHSSCVSNKWNFAPSLGMTGKYCTCFKPETSSVDIPSLNINSDDDKNEIITDEMEIVAEKDIIREIWNKDFVSGTFRIKKPGIYRIMEDIYFTMNAPDIKFDKNNIDTDYDYTPNAENAFYPLFDQQKEYAGSDGFVGPYSMGFFAGFALECDDIVIDLNGFTLQQSMDFYIQQRFFSLIEVGSKLFISGQGPGNFGGSMSYAANVIIRDGNLGLTSHHAIHGNYAKNLQILNVNIKDFEVAGIALNGFDGVVIDNVDIGPNCQRVPLTGLYTQARIILERLRAVSHVNPEGTVYFHNRDGEYTAADIMNELQLQMNMAFYEAAGIKMSEPVSERMSRAKNTFLNPRGLPVGGTVYGIFLNAQGASVFGIGLAPGSSTNARLSNIRIHHLRSEPWETVRYRFNRGPMGDLFDMKMVTDLSSIDETSENLNDLHYTGNAYSDAQYAIGELAVDWSILGHSSVSAVSKWIKFDSELQWKKERTDKNYGYFTVGEQERGYFGCNSDVMIHVTKGIFGLRLDTVMNVEIENVEIAHLHNVGSIGEDVICGNYYSSSNGGHHNQNYPLEIGYTGGDVHGFSTVRTTGSITDISVTDLLSANGDVFGMQFYPGNNLQINGKIHISDIHSGAYLLSTEHISLPNTIPRSCAIDVWSYEKKDTRMTANKLVFADDISVDVSCVTQKTDCTFDFEKYITPYVTTADDIFDHSLNADYAAENVVEYAKCSPEDIGYIIDDVVDDSPRHTMLDVMAVRSEYHATTLAYAIAIKDNKAMEFHTHVDGNSREEEYNSQWQFVLQAQAKERIKKAEEAIAEGVKRSGNSAGIEDDVDIDQYTNSGLSMDSKILSGMAWIIVGLLAMLVFVCVLSMICFADRDCCGYGQFIWRPREMKKERKSANGMWAESSVSMHRINDEETPLIGDDGSSVWQMDHAMHLDIVNS